MNGFLNTFRKNRTQFITFAFLIILFLMAIQGMETSDWVITMLRSLAVGSITFLVASGFSIIFGLMDVLNLAHGTLFMIGAYVGWTVFVRPDTFIDGSTPIGLIGAGLALIPLFSIGLKKLPAARKAAKVWPWVGLLFGLVISVVNLRKYPITSWDPAIFSESPITYAFQAGQGQITLPTTKLFTSSPWLILAGIIVGGILVSVSIAGFGIRGEIGGAQSKEKLPRGPLGIAALFFVLGMGAFLFHGALTDLLLNLDRTLLFLLAIGVAFLTGFILGTVMEGTLIRPLYARPLYQILMTLGISLIGVEIVRGIWGRPEFTMPKPAIFNGTGDGCPAVSFADLLRHQCSTISLMDSRVRTYNEIFVPLVGLVVLVTVWLLLKRTRLGMIIRAGVQDSEMVEALGINVRQVFTMVFALGVGLAALGGVIAGPSMGLSNGMGESLLINALIALAIGGLTSFPGAAAGSLLVGLLQQFIIKYGQIGINIPFIAEPFKPTPPLVPASTVLLMVIVLLILPHGLFGKKE